MRLGILRKALCILKSMNTSVIPKAGSLNEERVFFVLVAPSLITTPTDQTVMEGAEAIFFCNATGNPIPKITWMKDGEIVGQGDTLSFETSRNQSGKYLCSAENGLNSTVNSTANLDVQCMYLLTILKNISTLKYSCRSLHNFSHFIPSSSKVFYQAI